MAKALINGATGFLGETIARRFAEAGYTLRLSDRPGADFKTIADLDAEMIPADIQDAEAQERLVAGVDVVINVAGVFDYAMPWHVLDRINHWGVRTLAQAVLRKNPHLKRFVQLSSVGVYGCPTRVPVREDDLKNPGNAYEATKWKGEQVAFEYHRLHGLPVTAIRPTLVYGPNSRYGHSMLIGLLSLLAQTGRRTLPVFRNGPMTHHVHAADVAEGIRLLAEKDEAVGRAFNIVDQTPVPPAEFIGAICRPLGIEPLAKLPFARRPMAALCTILRHSGWLLNGINRWIDRRWAGIRSRHGLSADLRPRLDRDWFGYFTDDRVYDNGAIARLGMQWRYPDYGRGMAETVAWYQEKRWIPATL